MSLKDLFDEMYSRALRRGHVVHVAYENYRARFPDWSREKLFELVEACVDARDEFTAGMARVPSLRTAGPADGVACPICGGPHCVEYGIARAVRLILEAAADELR
jgi:hypothetical protein